MIAKHFSASWLLWVLHFDDTTYIIKDWMHYFTMSFAIWIIKSPQLNCSLYFWKIYFIWKISVSQAQFSPVQCPLLKKLKCFDVFWLNCGRVMDSFSITTTPSEIIPAFVGSWTHNDEGIYQLANSERQVRMDIYC